MEHHDPQAPEWPDSLLIQELQTLRHELRIPLKILIYTLTQCVCASSGKAEILDRATGAIVQREDAHYDAQQDGYIHEGGRLCDLT
jgi:hypothetical protein